MTAGTDPVGQSISSAWKEAGDEGALVGHREEGDGEQLVEGAGGQSASVTAGALVTDAQDRLIEVLDR